MGWQGWVVAHGWWRMGGGVGEAGSDARVCVDLTGGVRGLARPCAMWPSRTLSRPGVWTQERSLPAVRALGQGLGSHRSAPRAFLLPITHACCKGRRDCADQSEAAVFVPSSFRLYCRMHRGKLTALQHARCRCSGMSLSRCRVACRQVEPSERR